MDKMIRISTEVHNRLKIEAAKRQASMKDLAEKAIRNIIMEEQMSYKQEEGVKIVVKFSRDGVDPDNILEQRHINDYAESLQAEIEADYPNADVSVTENIGDHVDVVANSWSDYGSIGSDVEQIIADHWQPWIDRVASEL